MGNRYLFLSLAAIAVIGLAFFWSATAVSYPSYHPNDQPDEGCFQCHNGFDGRGPLHDMHVGSSQMTGTCTLCHTSIGDDPLTDESGSDPNHSCNGCHNGPGLRLHHANAGAPADALGLFCANCHPGDPTPPDESVAPPYYSRTDVNVSDPCETNTALGGEDYSGDGAGLDNDGDLAYDANDPDCQSTPITPSTWGTIKSIFE